MNPLAFKNAHHGWLRPLEIGIDIIQADDIIMGWSRDARVYEGQYVADKIVGQVAKVTGFYRKISEPQPQPQGEPNPIPYY